jgi:hypothetical protein
MNMCVVTTVNAVKECRGIMGLFMCVYYELR